MENKGKQEELVKADFTLKDIYKSYIKKLDGFEVSNGYKVTEKIHNGLCKEFNEEVANLIIKDAYEFTMHPLRSKLRVRKYKPSKKYNEDGTFKYKLSANWQKTRELWAKDEDAKNKKIIIYHINNHSDGYIYKWYFDRRKCAIRNATYYTFLASRTHKRNLAKLIKENNNLNFYE